MSYINNIDVNSSSYDVNDIRIPENVTASSNIGKILVVDEDGKIKADDAPTGDVTKAEVIERDTQTLDSAKSYTDGKVGTYGPVKLDATGHMQASNLPNANNYLDNKFLYYNGNTIVTKDASYNKIIISMDDVEEIVTPDFDLLGSGGDITEVTEVSEVTEVTETEEVTEVEETIEGYSITIKPNTTTIITTDIDQALHITLKDPSDNVQDCEYRLVFKVVSGGESLAINAPTGYTIVWGDGAPTLSAGSIYEMSFAVLGSAANGYPKGSQNFPIIGGLYKEWT